jgi:hypothetical protein
MNKKEQCCTAIHEVFGIQDLMRKIMSYLDISHLHILGQVSKSLRSLYLSSQHFSKFSNDNWESCGDSGRSFDVNDLQRFCSLVKTLDHLSFIQTLDLWLEDLVVEHCRVLAGSLHHVTHLRLCCEQLCDVALSCLTSSFRLLNACHLITCPLLTPKVFTLFQTLPGLCILRLESCSGIKSHHRLPQLLQQSLPLMTSLQCLELNGSVSPNDAEVFAVLSLSVRNAGQPLRIHNKSCIDEPIFQGSFHQDIAPFGPVSFFCADCGAGHLRSERYITWFPQACALLLSQTAACEFLVFAFPQDQVRSTMPSDVLFLHVCSSCSVATSPVPLDDNHSQFSVCPAVAIPVRAATNDNQQSAFKGLFCMRRTDGIYVPKIKSRQRQLWYACM